MNYGNKTLASKLFEKLYNENTPANSKELKNIYIIIKQITLGVGKPNTRYITGSVSLFQNVEILEK